MPVMLVTKQHDSSHTANLQASDASYLPACVLLISVISADEFALLTFENDAMVTCLYLDKIKFLFILFACIY
jgi:hypothetical protein